MTQSNQSQRNISEFFTVSVEFCAFLNKIDKFNRIDFIDKSTKILSLLYLKASILADIEIDSDGFVEKGVTENDYNKIHSSVALKIAQFETYFDIIETPAFESGETVNTSISESFADIYQDLMNFVMQYRDNEDEERLLAIAECMNAFKEYWGIRALRLMAELHNIRYCGDPDLNDSSQS